MFDLIFIENRSSRPCSDHRQSLKLYRCQRTRSRSFQIETTFVPREHEEFYQHGRFPLCLEAVKGREDIETLREQYETSVTEYDKLKDEHKKLQVMRSTSFA